VGGAVWVGNKQVSISRGQLDLQRLNLQERLFDRRFQIYRAAQNYLGDIFRSANSPGPEATREFWRNVDQAQFLFRAEVHAELVEFLKEAQALDLCEVRLHGEDRLPAGPERTEFAARRAKCLQFFMERGDRLPKIFETELRIEQQP
jgi:hypothetical protein